MNQKPHPIESSDEIDFSKVRSLGKGVFYEKYWRSKGVRVPNPELARHFPDDASLNEAPEEYLRGKHEDAKPKEQTGKA